MKRKAWKSNAIALVVGSALLPAVQSYASPTVVHDFALIDHQGGQQQLSRLGNNKAVIVIAQSNSCPESIEQLHRYKLLQTTWAGKGVDIVMLNASPEDNLESIRRTAKLYDIGFPIMHDESQLVAETLGVTKAGEVFVIEPNSKTLLYRGGLDRAQMRGAGDDAGPSVQDAAKAQKAAGTPLADAIGRAVAGKLDQDTVVTPAPAKGCAIDYPVRTAQTTNVPDYATQVAPILKQNCARCHVQ